MNEDDKVGKIVTDAAAPAVRMSEEMQRSVDRVRDSMRPTVEAVSNVTAGLGIGLIGQKMADIGKQQAQIMERLSQPQFKVPADYWNSPELPVLETPYIDSLDQISETLRAASEKIDEIRADDHRQRLKEQRVNMYWRIFSALVAVISLLVAYFK